MRHRIAKTIVIALTCVALASPAFAVDTGGGSSSSNNSGSSSSQASGPTIEDARGFIKAGQYKSAIGVLKVLIADDPNNADALNLMGFSLRKSGDPDRALGFYLKALKINPKHRGANEYLGELYVEIGQIDKAKERLKVLEGICGTSCEEYEDLAEAIASL